MTDRRDDGMRTCLMYAQDSKGMGHIVRSVTIARHILAAFPKTVAYLATESPIAGDFPLPDRCDYVKLPMRLSLNGGFAPDPEELEARDRFRGVRSRILQEVALGLSPDLVLVDHEPLGRKGEFRDGLFALKEQSPETKFVFGLRDIMDGVERTRTLWEELGVYDALENLYDGIAVYGSRDLFDVAKAYAIPPSVRPKLHYCGFVIREPPRGDPTAIRREHRLPAEGPLVVATVGGGSDGFPVLDATLDAVAKLQKERPNLNAILVTGPLMPSGFQDRLRAKAPRRCRVISRADNFQLMAAADAIVSMGGYNSVCEALSLGRPLVIVPRATHKIEQQIRAETLAARGLAQWVHPKELDGARLAEALRWALARDPDAHGRLVRSLIPSFDGAARLTEYLARWLGPLEDRERPPLEIPPLAEGSA